MGFDQDERYCNVSFSGSASYDPDGGPIVQYTWTYQADPFPNGTQYHQCSFTKTYYEPGAYNQIKLYVTDDEQQTDWEYCHLYLVESVLNVYYAGEWMDDPDEYDDGAFILLNDDDDNDNGVPDNDPGETTVAGENDLLPLYVLTDPLPSYLQQGEVTLEFVSGTSKIKVWRYNDKQVELTLPKTWPIEQFLDETFYIEGVSLSGSLRDVELKLTYACGSESSVDRVRFTVFKPGLSGPENVVLGVPFTLNATVTPAFNVTADISIDQGTSYSSQMRSESYWDAQGNPKTTPQYKHEFGIKLPDPPTVAINNGVGPFDVTQFTMEPFKIKIVLQRPPNPEATYEIEKEHCWAKVKATYIGQPRGPESESDSPGYFDNDKPRAALPYGWPRLHNSWIFMKKTLDGGSVDATIRDRGPWFPYGSAYPSNTSWYNDYWDDAGWKPLAEFMQGLRRAGDTYPWYAINGAALDLTQKAITDLGFQFSGSWSGTVYWRFK